MQYSKKSPYHSTKKYGNFLDVLTYRKIPISKDDKHYKIDSIYAMRPDLLAHDMYDSPDLWWVFAVTNPDVIQDPIYDFVEGKVIRIPPKDTIINSLGI
jgi:hypothetical protein